MKSSRKRVISSCIPCYTRKQKCNKAYPCNHCTRRQRTDGCFYYSNDGKLDGPVDGSDARRDSDRSVSSRTECNSYAALAAPAVTVSSTTSPLAEYLGYFQNSSSNTLALLQKVGLARRDDSCRVTQMLGSEAVEEVHHNLERMPDRQILDFLVQYFIAEVNWMDQLIHVPWFSAKYQSWWTLKRITHVAGVDFAVLILRLCSYTLQFLPSPGYTLDSIRGVPLADIRNACDEAADGLEAIAVAANSRGSLIRVQHVAFFGLRCQIEAKTHASWEIFGRALRIAQNIGLHCDGAILKRDIDVTSQEMERRTYCNLFIWDDLISRQLDRVPLHPGRLHVANWPQLHSLPNSEDETSEHAADSHDPFTVRLLQAKLAEFWRTVGPQQYTEYDMVAAEERYDKFCSEYLSQLPPKFALKDPDTSSDKRFLKLALQRKLLHVAIYDSIYCNFRPLLLRPPTPLPVYKSFIVSSQKRKLAAAALLALESVTDLHTLLGSCHTRLAGIIFTTFESAVLLVFMYADPLFEEDCPPHHLPPPGTLRSDPLQATICHTTRHGCMQAVKIALKRLKMLAEVSRTADATATTLTHLMAKAAESSTIADSTMSGTDEQTLDSRPNQTPTNSLPSILPNKATTTAPSTRTVSAAHPETPVNTESEMVPWLPVDLMDYPSGVNGLVTAEESLAESDMASWLPYDGSNLFAQQGWANIESS